MNNMWYGRRWCVQYATAYAINLGFHVDLRRRHTNSGQRYGPYVDFHLPFFIVSFGINPVYSGELDLIVSYSRGGLSGNDN